MEVVREIDSGAFGRVEEVLLAGGVRAARKTFDPKTREEDREKAKLRFQREVGVQRMLPDRVALEVLSAGLEDNPPWFVMPLASENFAAQIRRDSTAGLVSSQPLAEILEALEAIHGLGLVHRDLKPSNVLRHDGRWKISDFGLVLQDSGATRLTSTRSAWGTPEYAAPEQRTEFRDVTAAADIYAFGCILHDIVDGGDRIPYARVSVPGPLAPVVEKCTEVDPSRRFQDVVALRSALFTALASPAEPAADAESTDFVTKFDKGLPWSVAEFENLLRFVDRSGVSSEEVGVVFHDMTAEAIELLHHVDSKLWGQLARTFCDWTSNGFNFGFCDVLVNRLEKIVEIGTLEHQAKAILAAARLGRVNNRWYVMGRVKMMCGPTMDERLARRVAIEIKIEGREDDFDSCVRQTSTTADAYHPEVRRMLP